MGIKSKLRGGAGAGRGDNAHAPQNPFPQHVDDPKDPFAGHGKTWGPDAQGNVSSYHDQWNAQQDKKNAW